MRSCGYGRVSKNHTANHFRKRNIVECPNPGHFWDRGGVNHAPLVQHHPNQGGGIKGGRPGYRCQRSFTTTREGRGGDHHTVLKKMLNGTKWSQGRLHNGVEGVFSDKGQDCKAGRRFRATNSFLAVIKLHEPCQWEVATRQLYREPCRRREEVGTPCSGVHSSTSG